MVMSKIMSVLEKARQLDKSFFKKPLLMVNDSYLGVARFKGRYRLHKHDRDELFFVLDGKLIIQVEDKIHTVEPGGAILIRKGEEHVSMSQEETHVLVFEPQNINFDPLE